MTQACWDKQEFEKSVGQGIVPAFKDLVPRKGIDFQSTSEDNILKLRLCIIN